MGLKDSIGAAVKLLVDVRDADLKARLQEALLAAQGEALDLQERLTGLLKDNTQLSQQLQALEELSKTAGQLFYARHAYWRKDEEICSAYCPTCWDSSRKSVRLMRTGDHGHCHVCGNDHHYVYDGPRPKKGDTATPEHSDDYRPSPGGRDYHNMI